MGTDAPVLVVEDHADTRAAILALLAIRGYPAIGAGDGVQALDYLRKTEGEASLVLLDLQMPRMDGYAFLEAKRADAVLRDIPVVVFSATPDDRLPAGVPHVAKARDTPDQLLTTIERERRKG